VLSIKREIGRTCDLICGLITVALEWPCCWMSLVEHVVYIKKIRTGRKILFRRP